MKKWYLAGVLALALLACGEKTSQEEIKMPDPKDFAYLHLVGTIGDTKVHLNLLQDLDYDDNPWYNGYYTDDAVQEPIGLYSSVDSTGQGLLNLTEITVADVPYGQFSGKLEKGIYSGEYTNPVGKKIPFSLKIAQPAGSLIFKAKRLEESELADEKRKESPAAHFAYEYFIPAEQWLKTAFLKEMIGDSLAALYQTPEKAFAAEKAQYFKDYQVEVKDMMTEEELPLYLNYDYEQTMEVLFNQDNLLSIAFMTYTYAGGAHGNYGSACASFDLAKKKKIKLSDVFKPGYEKALTQALTEAAKQKFKTQDLNEVLFVDKIEPNGNFFLTGKGICFNYVPYEIAAYAAGELKIFVPFTELKAVLR